MSGSTNNILGGVASITIDGTQYPVLTDGLMWSPSTQEYETKMGADGYHGVIVKLVPGYIACKLRDSGTNIVAAFQQKTNSEVILTQINGKTVSGYQMVCMKALEVDAIEATYDVRFEGPTVTEDGA